MQRTPTQLKISRKRLEWWPSGREKSNGNQRKNEIGNSLPAIKWFYDIGVPQWLICISDQLVSMLSRNKKKNAILINVVRNLLDPRIFISAVESNDMFFVCFLFSVWSSFYKEIRRANTCSFCLFNESFHVSCWTDWAHTYSNANASSRRDGKWWQSFTLLTTLSLSLHLYIFSSFFPSCTYNPTGRCRVSFQFAFTWFSLPSVVVVVAHTLFFFLKDLHEPTPPSSRLLIITKFRQVTHAKIPRSAYRRRCAFPLTVMYTWLTLYSPVFFLNNRHGFVAKESQLWSNEFRSVCQRQQLAIFIFSYRQAFAERQSFLSFSLVSSS